MKIVVAGVNGFVGHHVAQALRATGHEIVGIGREPSVTKDLDGLLSSYTVCDLADPAAVAGLDLDDARAVINLAGFAKVGVNEDERELYRTINCAVHQNLAEAIKQRFPDVRMVSVSSGAVYAPDQDMPLTEDSRLQDPDKAGVYAASKLYMEEVLKPYQQAGLPIIIARPFNHSGPGQQPGFLIPDLTSKLSQATGDDTITCGNLTTKRDYTHVFDVAQAYVRLATAETLTHDIYNIASGKSVAGTNIFRLIQESLGKQDIGCTTDPALQRRNDPPELYGSYERLKADTGWEPILPIEDIIKDFVAWYRESQV